MKLLVHAAIFSVIFAGFVASAVTTKHTNSLPANHSLVVSRAMPVPSCRPKTGCALNPDWTVLTRIHNSTQTAHT
jgi:hypothetical protein